MSIKYMICQITLLLLALGLAIGIYSCSNAEKKEQSQVIDQPTGNDSSSYLNSNIEFLLPSPEDLLGLIFKNEIKYNPEFILQPRLEKNIVNSNIQALIMGVYITDFSYSLLYNDINRSSKSLEAIKRLSENIGIGGLFNDRFFKKLEENLNNIDSMKIMFSDFSENSFSTLSETGNKELLSLIAMGVSIESIYLGYETSKNKSFDNSLKPFFIEQRMVFENFYMNYMNYNKDKEDLKSFNNSLNTFYSLFKLNVWLIVDKYSVLKKDSSFSIDVSYTLKTNQENVSELGKCLQTLRSNLVDLKYQ